MNIIKAYKSCAACKYQRRKCSKDCPLAPYFPGDKPKIFANAHRLFGVSNILTILKVVKDEDKNEAMKSIIFESDIRARFQTHGCLGVIKMYESALKECIKELDDVERLLDYCKLNCHSVPSTSNHNIGDIIPPIDGDYAMEDNTNLMGTKGLSHNEELVLDTKIDTTFDSGKEEIFSDYNIDIDDLIYFGQPFEENDASQFSRVFSIDQTQNDQLKNIMDAFDMETSIPA